MPPDSQNIYAELIKALELRYGDKPVSYTHLDVYKRQQHDSTRMKKHTHTHTHRFTVKGERINNKKLAKKSSVLLKSKLGVKKKLLIAYIAHT